MYKGYDGNCNRGRFATENVHFVQTNLMSFNTFPQIAKIKFS